MTQLTDNASDGAGPSSSANDPRAGGLPARTRAVAVWIVGIAFICFAGYLANPLFQSWLDEVRCKREARENLELENGVGGEAKFVEICVMAINLAREQAVSPREQ